MTVTLRLTSTVRCLLDWSETDDDLGISMQQDNADDGKDIGYLYGSGDKQINEAWYKEISLSSNATYTVDLLMLPVTILNLTIFKNMSKVKGVFIENQSANTPLVVGNSGVSQAIDLFGYSIEIGNSGIYEMISDYGISVNASKSKFVIANPSTETVSCKVLVIGVV